MARGRARENSVKGPPRLESDGRKPVTMHQRRSPQPKGGRVGMCGRHGNHDAGTVAIYTLGASSRGQRCVRLPVKNPGLSARDRYKLK